MNELSLFTPAELILERFQAFCRGDFRFIFDSYHSESNFRRQFVSADDYIQFGQASLGQDFKLVRCQILAEQMLADEAQVIFLMEMTAQGETLLYAELVWQKQEGGVWRCHRSQKMTAEDLPKNPEVLNFADFARLDPATIF